MKFIKSEEEFWKYVDTYLIRYNKRYRITTTNSTITIVWDQEKNLGIRFRKSLSDEDMKKLWVFSSVKRQVKKWLTDNRLQVLANQYSSVKKGLLYRNMPEGEVFMGTDLNHCYWRIAYNMGYISKDLYERLTPREYKLSRNKALACLRSKQTIYDYQGEVRMRKPVFEGDSELEQLYNDIRNRAYRIMYEIALSLKDDFIKYHTDCIYYRNTPENKAMVEKKLTDENMLFTTFRCYKIDHSYFIEMKDGTRDAKNVKKY